jgi:hypothetical protein
VPIESAAPQQTDCSVTWIDDPHVRERASPLVEHAMDIAKFEELIDRLGDDPSRWPDDQRREAERLVATSAEAQRLLADAKAVREALAAPPVRAPAGLADRIVTAARQAQVEPQGSTEGEADQPAAAKVFAR